MKKFLLVLSVIFILNLSCKKEQRLCGCSPMPQPTLLLALKNASGVDLLNPATAGYLDKQKIRFYYKDPNGTEKTLNFAVMPPIDNSSAKIDFYQLLSPEMVTLALDGKTTFYLEIVSYPTFELNVKANATEHIIEKLEVNKKELVKEPLKNSLIAFYSINL